MNTETDEYTKLARALRVISQYVPVNHEYAQDCVTELEKALKQLTHHEN